MGKMAADLGEDGEGYLFRSCGADVEACGGIDAADILLFDGEFGEEFGGAFVWAEDADIGGGGGEDLFQVPFVGVVVMGHQQDGGVVIDDGWLGV